MRKTIIALLSLCLLAACSAQETDIPTPETEYGYIRLGISANPVIVVTKATTPSDAELDEYTITLLEKKESGNSQIWSKKYKNITNTDLTQPAGTYTVTATNLTTDEAYPETNPIGSVRVSGSKDITVSAGASTTCDITCNPINSKVTYYYTKNFKDAGLNPSITFSQGTRTLSSLAENAEAYFEPYVKESNNALTWTLSITTTDSGTKTPSGTVKLEAGKWTTLTFDVTNAPTTENGTLTLQIYVDDLLTEEETIDAVINPYPSQTATE